MLITYKHLGSTKREIFNSVLELPKTAEIISVDKVLTWRGFAK